MAYKKKGGHIFTKDVSFDEDILGEFPLPSKFDKGYLVFLQMNDVRRRLNNLMAQEDLDSAKIHLKNLEIWLINKISPKLKLELQTLETRYANSRAKVKTDVELLIVEKEYIFRKFALLMFIVDEEYTQTEVIDYM